MLAFSLTVAVLLDAFIIRMTLVPAALALLGDRAWRLPTWLDRIVPHIDVEGATLLREQSARPSAAGDDTVPAGAGPASQR